MDERKPIRRSGDSLTLRAGLGLCPVLTVATTALTGLCTGVAVACTLVFASLAMALVGGALSERSRAVARLVVSAALASVARMILVIWLPALFAAPETLAPLIAVASLILLGGERAAGESAGAAVAYGVGTGAAYALAATLLGAIRELVGRGALFGAAVLPAGYPPAALAALPAGGLIVLGVGLGIANAMRADGRRERERA